MKRPYALLLGCAMFAAVPAYAAGTGKVDSLLQKAMLDSAKVNTQPLMTDNVVAAPAEDEQAMGNEDIDQIEAQPVEEVQAMPPMDAENSDDAEMDEMDKTAVEVQTAQADTPEKPPKQPGFKMGAFMLKPVITLEEQYNDNILATPRNAESDFITMVTPEFSLDLQDSLHKLSLQGGYHGELYGDHAGENVHDGYIQASGDLKSTDALSFPFAIGMAVDHEDREDDLTLQLPTDRTRESTWNMMGGIKWKLGKPTFSLIGSYLNERFGNGRAMSGGAPVIRSDADRATREYKARLDYDYNEDRSFFAQVLTGERGYDKRNYQGGGFNGPRRDSTWKELRGGMFMKMANVKTDVSFGYRDWDHDDSAVSRNTREFVGDANVSLDLAGKTIIALDLHRDLYEDDEVINLIRRTTGEVSVTRNFNDKFSMALAGTYKEFNFVDSPREDDTYGFRINADYKINPRFSAGLEYAVDSKAVKPPGGLFEFDRQTITARLRGDL